MNGPRVIGIWLALGSIVNCDPQNGWENQRVCEVTEEVDLAVDLPADEAAHREELEWWYWTGHLKTEDDRWFGFETIFFLAEKFGIGIHVQQPELGLHVVN